MRKLIINSIIIYLFMQNNVFARTAKAGNDIMVYLPQTSTATLDGSTISATYYQWNEISTMQFFVDSIAAPTLTTNGQQAIISDSTALVVTPTWAPGHTGAISWTQISGPNIAAIENDMSYSTWVKNLITGNYIFRCTVTQDDHQTAYADVLISVYIPNIIITLPPPALTTNGDQSIHSDSTALVVTPTWAPGHCGAISWTQISGPNIAAIDNDLSYSTWVKNLITGNYIFRCTVTQDDHQTAYADVSIKVNTSIPPTLITNGQQAIISDSTALVVTPTWAPGHTGAISWTQISGPNIAAIDNDMSYSTWVRNLITGNYIFRCTVTQDDHQTAFADVLISIFIPIAPPTLTTNGNQSILNDSTALVVTPGWALGHSGAISWTQISGPNFAAIDNDMSYSTWVKNLITGNYIFRCTVTQDDNQARYADVLITVNIPIPAPTLITNGNQSIINDSTALVVTPGWAPGHVGGILWTQISGPNIAAIDNDLSYSTWVKNLITGNYIFRCTVTQDDNQARYADVLITVNIPEMRDFASSSFDRDSKFNDSGIVKLNTNIASWSAKVTPNPISEKIYLKIESTIQDNATVMILDLSGRILYKENISINAGNNSYEINEAAGFSNGAYFLSIFSTSQRKVIEVIKIGQKE